MKRILSLTFFLLSLSFSGFAQPYTIQQYLNIKSAGSPTFSPDGSQIAYLTNVTGTTQIWVVNLPAGKPRQLTNYEDNVGFVRWLPKGNAIIFGKAKGGDENTQFYWMKADGTDVKALTSDPVVRHNFGGIGTDGSYIYYSSNKRNRNYFDIYRMRLDNGKEETLYQNDSDNSIVAVNETGSRFIVSRSGADMSLDNNLYLIELNTKTETLITPHTGASQYGNVRFLPDSKSLLMATDENSEFSKLTNLRLKNPANSSDWSDKNRKTEILDQTNWDVSEIAMQNSASVFAYTINRDGFSDLFIQQIETDGKPLISVFLGKPTQVKLPAQGIVSGIAFTIDQDKLAFSFSSATQNGDIWVYDLKSKSLDQVTKSDSARIAQTSFVAPELIKYKSFDGKDIPAWYYRPLIAPAKNRRVIVSVHGGPEGQERPGFNPLYQYYLSRGYAVLATNVRGSTGYGRTFTHLDDVKKREDSVKDLAYAVEWLKTKGGADAKRIAVMGGSYGGYMTLAAITLYPELWAAAVCTVGISNWESFLKNTSGYRRRQREVEYGRLDRDLDFLRSISPIAKIDRIKAPLFVIAGKNDPRVPYTEGEQMVNALKGRGAVVQWKLYDDEGHGISKLKNRLELFPLVANFLDVHMK